MTKATIIKITNVVFLSKPDVAAGTGDESVAFLKVMFTTCGGFRDLLSEVVSSALS